MTTHATPPNAEHDAAPRDGRESAAPRRAVLVTEGETVGGLEERLAAAGLDFTHAPARSAFDTVRGERPSLVLVAPGEGGDEGRVVTLARRLRAEAETLALPIVFLFRADARTLRSAALHVGADDYFSQDAEPAEIRARIASVLWRVKAGRRAAHAAGARGDERDNFIFLFDAVGADARDGLTGSVVLAEAEEDSADGGGSRSALWSAHGFLKLNLRRSDAVTFYGPETLLVYMPGARAEVARATLSGLCEGFNKAHARARLFAGVAAFPGDGAEVETLVEKAEVALRRARREGARPPVLVYGEEASAATRAEASSELSDAVASDARRAPLRAPGGPQKLPRTAPDEVRKGGGEVFGARRAGASRVLLVVSDAARMAHINLLMRSAHYEVRAAFDGTHALTLMRFDSPDLLLADYELRGMNGLELLRNLPGGRAGAGFSTPAVLLAPAGRDDIRREALEAGARAVVHLPYDPGELLRALRDAGGREG